MTDQLFTVPAKLTERQQFVYDLLKHQEGKAFWVGVMVHRWQGRDCCRSDNCPWAEQAGREVLRALHRKGLLKRDRHHVYRRTDQPSTAQTDQIPY